MTSSEILGQLSGLHGMMRGLPESVPAADANHCDLPDLDDPACRRGRAGRTTPIPTSSPFRTSEPPPSASTPATIRCAAPASIPSGACGAPASGARPCPASATASPGYGWGFLRRYRRLMTRTSYRPESRTRAGLRRRSARRRVQVLPLRSANGTHARVGASGR